MPAVCARTRRRSVMHTLRPKTKVLKLISKHITVDVQRNLLKVARRERKKGTPWREQKTGEGGTRAVRTACVCRAMSGW